MLTKNLSLFDDKAARIQTELLQLFEDWIEHRSKSTSNLRTEKALREESAEVYREMWQSFARFCASRELDLPSILEQDLISFLDSRGTGDDCSAPRVSTKNAELNARYGRRYLTLIDRLTKFHGERTGIAVNGAAQTLLQKEEYRLANIAEKDPLPEYLSPIKAKRLIAFLTQIRDKNGEPLSWKTLRDRTAVALMLGGGLSPGDVRALQLDGVITIGGRQKDTPWKLALPGNGNFPARETPIAEWAGRQLALWLKVRTEQNIAGPLVFPSTRAGKTWSHTGCYESSQVVLKEAGMGNDPGGMFQLRHSFAVRQLSKGKSEEQVAQWLGLVDVGNMERYRRIVHSPQDLV